MKNKLSWLAIGLFALILIWMVGTKLYRNSQQDEIYAAVIQYAATSEGNSLNMTGLKLFFVDIEGEDVSQNFITRCQNLGASVRKGSQGQNFKQLRSGDITSDSASNEKGVVVRFRPIAWASNSQPFVMAGGYGFTMVKDYGAWRVENQTLFSG